MDLPLSILKILVMLKTHAMIWMEKPWKEALCALSWKWLAENHAAMTVMDRDHHDDVPALLDVVHVLHQEDVPALVIANVLADPVPEAPPDPDHQFVKVVAEANPVRRARKET